MKRIFAVIMDVKSYAAMVFCGLTLAYTVIGWLFFEVEAVSVGLVMQFLGIAALASILQYIFLSENVIKKMRYSIRLLLYFIPLYLLVSGFAVGFQWFPINVGTWALFSVIFIAIFLILTAVFAIYYRIVGQRYQERLDAFKTKQAE